jgi:hypothetical protein
MPGFPGKKRKHNPIFDYQLSFALVQNIVNGKFGMGVIVAAFFQPVQHAICPLFRPLPIAAAIIKRDNVIRV